MIEPLRKDIGDFGLVLHREQCRECLFEEFQSMNEDPCQPFEALDMECTLHDLPADALDLRSQLFQARHLV